VAQSNNLTGHPTLWWLQGNLGDRKSDKKYDEIGMATKTTFVFWGFWIGDKKMN
jgi:hypothetical protein